MGDKPRFRYNWKTGKWDKLYTFNTSSADINWIKARMKINELFARSVFG